MFGNCDSRFLQRERLICPIRRFGTDYIAFSEEIIRSFTRSKAILQHDGCVNAVQWTRSGDKMLSGSDDRTVKIWDTSGDLNSVKCLHTVRTEHDSNIFCVNIDENMEQFVLSCAADGTLRSSDIYSRTGRSVLVRSDDIMHMFICDRLNRNIVYTAEEFGAITRVDLRDNNPEIVYKRELSVKTICQPNTGSGHMLVVGGQGFRVGEIDLRMPMSSATEDTPPFIRTWMPQGRVAEMYRRGNGFSASSVSLSSDDRSLLVNYQGDQIYIFDYLDRCTKEKEESTPIHIPNSTPMEEASSVTTTVTAGRTSADEHPIAPKACLGGHINADTFLKKAAFFGPRDEYVVTGCDSGYVWIWSSSSGQLLEQKERVSNEDEFGIVKLINVLDADRRICNGVVPHPVLPVLASYGIDLDVKLWLYETPDEDDDKETAKDNRSRDNSTRHSVCTTGRTTTATAAVTAVMGRNVDLKAFSKLDFLMKQVTSILDENINKLYGGKFLLAIAAARRLLLPPVPLTEPGIIRLDPDWTGPDDNHVLMEDEPVGFPMENISNEKMADLIKYRRIVAGIRYDLDNRRSKHRIANENGWITPNCPDDLGFVPGQSISQMMTLTVDDLLHRLMEVHTEEEARIMAVLVILQLIKIVEEAKQEGNVHFKAGIWLEARKCYCRGINYAATIKVCFHELLENLDKLKLKKEKNNKKNDKKCVPNTPNVSVEKDVAESETASENNSTEHPLSEVLTCIWYGKKDQSETNSMSSTSSSSNTLYALEKTIYSNQAANFLQRRDFAGTLHYCKLAIELSPDLPRTASKGFYPDSKLLYRQGCAYLGLRQHKEALASFSQALAMNPGDVTVIKKMKETKRAMEEMREEEQKQYKKMFA
eukprot:gene1269-2454_t